MAAPGWHGPFLLPLSVHGRSFVTEPLTEGGFCCCHCWKSGSWEQGGLLEEKVVPEFPLVLLSLKRKLSIHLELPRLQKRDQSRWSQCRVTHPEENSLRRRVETLRSGRGHRVPYKLQKEQAAWLVHNQTAFHYQKVSITM